MKQSLKDRLMFSAAYNTKYVLVSILILLVLAVAKWVSTNVFHQDLSEAWLVSLTAGSTFYFVNNIDQMILNFDNYLKARFPFLH